MLSLELIAVFWALIGASVLLCPVAAVVAVVDGELVLFMAGVAVVDEPLVGVPANGVLSRLLESAF